MFIYIIIIFIVLMIGYCIFIYNSIIKLNNNVKEAFSTMDVYLKKRWDLIPNIIESIKGYAKHETETLNSITKLRNGGYNALSNEEKIKKMAVLNKEINKFILLAENYPDLKASDNFKDLNKNLSTIEDEIANSRKYYNATVRLFNNKIETFPNNILANILGYKSKSFFELVGVEEKENIKIDF